MKIPFCYALEGKLPPPPRYELGLDRWQIIERIYRPSPTPGKPPVLDEVREGRWEAF